MKQSPITETHTITKYDAAERMGERRQEIPLYWFDMVDRETSDNWLIMGVQHKEGAPVAEVDEIEFLREPIEAAEALRLGGAVLRAAAKDFHGHGAQQLSMEEPTVGEIRMWAEVFGQDNVALDPPVESMPENQDIYLQTKMSVDINRLDMEDWPKAAIFQD